MASLVMASSVTISMSSSACVRPVFSSNSSARVVSTASFPEPLRVFRGPSRSLYLVARSASPQGTQSTDLEEAVRHAIEEAEEVCAAEKVTPEECAEAWDEVEELAAAVAHKKLSEKKKEDLLQALTREASVASPEASPQVTQSRTGLKNLVQHAIEEAEEVCAAEETSPRCAEAWDEVEELASTVAHMKLADLEGSPGSNLL